MRIRWTRVVPPALGAVALGAALGLVLREPEAEIGGTLSVVETLGGADTAGYARAMAPRPFVFPADHGPHPEFRNEWWYVTGTLTATGGRRVGVQLTFFRSARMPDPPELESDWATRQVYMAHFAVTDDDRQRFVSFDRFGRGAVGIAGARAEPFRVWLRDWVMETAEDAVGAGPTRGSGTAGARPAAASGAQGIFPVRLRAADGHVALDLVLRAGTLLVHGDEGLSRKGPEAGNASYYYSFPRLPTEGTVVVAGDTLSVEGTAWLDREWSTSALGADLEGWDWFALRLEDGRDLMYYRLRRAGGGTDRFSGGVLVGRDGTAEKLAADDVVLEPLERWTSPETGVTYPTHWRVTVPSAGLGLTVTPWLRDQELDVAFRYWEGAVDVEGRGPGGPVRGVGYVELTGYDPAMTGGRR